MANKPIPAGKLADKCGCSCEILSVCEQCRIERITGERIPRGEDPISCEYPPDEEGVECERNAQYHVSDYSAEDHFCEKHMREKASQLEEGLGEFLRSAGFQAASDFAPIKEPAECEYISPQDMLSPADIPQCARPALYAELVLEKMALCQKHAKEWGYSPKASEP